MENIPKYNPKLRRRLEITSTILALIIIGFIIFSLVNYDKFKSGVESGVQVSGLIGVFMITFFLELVPQALNPVLGVAAAISANLNVHLVVLSAVLASTLGSCLGFWIGKKYGYKYIYVFFEEKQVVKVHRFWEKYGKWFVLVAAVTPVPYVPMIFGALEMSWKDFAIYGLAPRILNFAVPGYLIYLGLWGLPV